MKSIAQPADIGVDAYLRTISVAQADVDSCVRLADADCMYSFSDSIWSAWRHSNLHY